MKILFFSDIHGLSDNLYILEKLDNNEKFDKVIVLGDIFEAGALYSNTSSYNPLEVKKILNSFADRLLIIKGNRDFDLTSHVFEIKEGPVKYNIDNFNLVLAHGHEPLIENSLNNIILIHGHEHYPYIKVEENFINICVGSISLPRRNFMPSYAIYDKGLFVIYDIKGKIIDKIIFR